MGIAGEGQGGSGEFENVPATKSEEVIELPIRDGKSDDGLLIGTVSILKSAIPERPDWLLALRFDAFVSEGDGQCRTVEGCKLVEFLMIKDSEFIGLEASLGKQYDKSSLAIAAPECSKKLDAHLIGIRK